MRDRVITLSQHSKLSVVTNFSGGKAQRLQRIADQSRHSPAILKTSSICSVAYRAVLLQGTALCIRVVLAARVRCPPVTQVELTPTQPACGTA